MGLGFPDDFKLCSVGCSRRAAELLSSGFDALVNSAGVHLPGAFRYSCWFAFMHPKSDDPCQCNATSRCLVQEMDAHMVHTSACLCCRCHRHSSQRWAGRTAQRTLTGSGQICLQRTLPAAAQQLPQNLISLASPTAPPACLLSR